MILFEQEPAIFAGYPIPPSDNALKRPVRRWAKGGGRKVLAQADSENYIQYKSNVNTWRMQYFHQNAAALSRVFRWYQEGVPLGIIVNVKVHRERLYTAAGTIRRWDVTNLAKAVHDTFCTIANIDDSAFFDSEQRKIEVSKTRSENITLTIGPVKPAKE